MKRMSFTAVAALFGKGLAFLIGYGWFWGIRRNAAKDLPTSASSFNRMSMGPGKWKTTHQSFQTDPALGKGSWPYGSRSAQLFAQYFPDERITGAITPEGWIVSQER